MAKRSKKKRNKPYTGRDAAPEQTGPVVHHYKAEYRGPVREWWFEKKKTVKIVSIVSAVVIFVVWMLVSLLQMVF